MGLSLKTGRVHQRWLMEYSRICSNLSPTAANSGPSMLTLLGNTQTKGLAPAQTTIIIHLRSKQFVIYQSGNLLPISVTFIFGLPTGFYSRLPTFSPHGDLNYWRNAHELLLLAVKGGLTSQDKGLRSWIEYPRRTHSGADTRQRQRARVPSVQPCLHRIA
jgi:hypothetical protein